MNNTYKLLSIIKYTTLKIKAKSATKNDVKELLKSISPDENYLCTLLTYLEQVGDYELSEDEFEQLSKLLAGGSAKEAMKIFYFLMFSKVEQEGLNHNPIQLMFNILSSETDLETEKTKVNDIQRLMSVFYIQTLNQTSNTDPEKFALYQNLQNLYLYFLIGLFGIKFTTLHKSVHDALGQLLCKYYSSIGTKFEQVLEEINKCLRLRPNNLQFGELVCPHQTLEFLERHHVYKFLEIKEKKRMELITMYENMFKSIEK